MKDQETVTVDLHIENENGNVELKQLEMTKATKDILDAKGIFPEDLINDYVYTYHLEDVLQSIDVTAALTPAEQELLKNALQNALGNIDTLHHFDTHTLKDGITVCVNEYHSTGNIECLNADKIVQYYHEHRYHIESKD